jgi:hypothetical protein
MVKLILTHRVMQEEKEFDNWEDLARHLLSFDSDNFSIRVEKGKLNHYIKELGNNTSGDKVD